MTKEGHKKVDSKIVECREMKKSVFGYIWSGAWGGDGCFC